MFFYEYSGDKSKLNLTTPSFIIWPRSCIMGDV